MPTSTAGFIGLCALRDRLYGRGSTTARYEAYSTVFSFNNNTVTGSPTSAGVPSPSGFNAGAFSTGAFAKGDTILGIGVRVISGGTINLFTPTVKFDLGNNSFQAASSVGGGDGRTSFSTYAETGDFTAQFDGANGWRPSVITAATSGNGFGRRHR